MVNRQKRQLSGLGQSICVARKLRQLTQAELAARARLSRQTIMSLEKGIPVKTDSLLAILFVLGLDEQLLTSVSLENDAVALRLAKLKAGGADEF